MLLGLSLMMGAQVKDIFGDVEEYRENTQRMINSFEEDIEKNIIQKEDVYDNTCIAFLKQLLSFFNYKSMHKELETYVQILSDELKKAGYEPVNTQKALMDNFLIEEDDYRNHVISSMEESGVENKFEKGLKDNEEALAFFLPYTKIIGADFNLLTLEQEKIIRKVAKKEIQINVA